MKITGLRTVVVDLPIKPPIVSAIFAIHSTSCILCFLETDEGLVGEGLVHAINGLRVKVLHEMVHSLEPLVLGLDPTLGGSFNARAWKELNFLGYEGVTIQAMAGIDMALWDLRGKAAGLNVSRLIGAVRQEVPAYASGGLWLSSSIDELQREAADFVAAGFRAVKTRVGPGKPEAMVARVRAVREAIGPDIGLMVDANQQLSVPEAIRLGRMLEPLNLTWFEEPVICYNHEGEAAICSGARHADRQWRDGAHPSRYSTHVAGPGGRHPHAGRSADGRADRVPQSRRAVRSFQHRRSRRISSRK